MQDKSSDPRTYISIINVLIPLYLVIALGFIAGRYKMADEFMMDRLNSFNAKFALPGLLFRNIANSNLYDAEFNIVLADIVFKLIAGVVIGIAAKLLSPSGLASENFIVGHSITCFPNFVVIGIPVLGAIYTPAVVKTYMALLLMEQVSIHLTFVAGFLEMVVKRGVAAAVVGEHAHGALMLKEMPRHTDAHGFAVRLRDMHARHELGRFLSHPRAYWDESGASDEGRAADRASGRASEIELGMAIPDASGKAPAGVMTAQEARRRGSAVLGLASAAGAAAGAAAAGSGSAHGFSPLTDEDEHHHGDVAVAVPRTSQTGLPGLKQAAKDDEDDDGTVGEAVGGPSVTSPPDHESEWHRVARIARDRLLLNPLVLSAVAGVITSLAVKAHNHKAAMPYILDTTSLYLNNCVLGVSLFNFGLFAHINGIISCSGREAVGVIVARFLASPLINLFVMYVFGIRGEKLKIMVMQAAIPQGVSSFVVFKEFKCRPEVFSTSLILGTAFCLPATCLWYFIMDKVVAGME